MDTTSKIRIKSQIKVKKVYSVYIQSVLNTRIFLDITEIGKNIKQTLEDKLISKIANRCIPEGYVSPNNIKIIQFSSGTIIRNSISYFVVYECNISHPVEGMLITAKTKTITKAGIHAQVIDNEGNIPITVFVARDHNISNTLFHSVKENDLITVKVIGIRYELNDPYVCVIANMFSVNELKKDHKKGGNVRSTDEINSEQEQGTADVMDINIEDSNCLSDI
jgi:DNA-directed RNA polymerase subunit E'/Rpb7